MLTYFDNFNSPESKISIGSRPYVTVSLGLHLIARKFWCCRVRALFHSQPMTALRLLVITSPGSPRCADISAHLETMHVPFEVSAAVFIKTPAEEFPDYDHAKRLRQFGYGLTAGEVGCFLAHRNAWETVARGTDPVLIIEDDARLLTAVPALLPCLSAIAQRTGYIIRLYGAIRRPARLWLEPAVGVKLVRPTSPSFSSVAYLLSPAAAQHLLKGCRRFCVSLDSYLDEETAHGCIILNTEPELVTHDDLAPSLIGGRIKPPSTIMYKVYREILRAGRDLRQRCHREVVLWQLGIRFRGVRKYPSPRTA